MKTGDILLNTYAGSTNPDRVLIFLCYDEGFIKCWNQEGVVLNYGLGNKFEVIGNIPIKDIIIEHIEKVEDIEINKYNGTEYDRGFLDCLEFFIENLDIDFFKNITRGKYYSKLSTYKPDQEKK